VAIPKFVPQPEDDLEEAKEDEEQEADFFSTKKIRLKKKRGSSFKKGRKKNKRQGQQSKVNTYLELPKTPPCNEEPTPQQRTQ